MHGGKEVSGTLLRVSAWIAVALLLQTAVPAQRGSASWSLELGQSFTSEADLDHTSGRFSMGQSRMSAELGLELRLKERLELGLSHEFRDYDFSANTGLPGGGSFDDAHRSRLSLGYQRVLDDDWAIFGHASLGLQFEGGADSGDAVVVGGVFGARYAIRSGLGLGLALFGVSRLEDDPWIFPIPILDWRVTRDLKVTTSRGITVEYELTDAGDLVLETELLFDFFRFRLRDDSPVRAGVVEHQRLPWTLRLGYEPSPSVEVGVFLGLVLWQEIEIDDASGRKLGECSAGPAATLGFSVSLTI
ncbi:MAG: hypothetical protein ACE5F1_20535 [Planctomycetota bacterium]